MNILNLLIKKRHAIGIEISDSNIRLAYFRPKKDKSNKKIGISHTDNELVLIEEKTPSNIISNGIVLEAESLGKILNKIWAKEKLGKSYAVVAIPEDKIYSQILSFPKTFVESQLKEGVDLAIDFELPFKRKDVYFGWENTHSPSHTQSDILVSLIPKVVANNYIKALEFAGINVLAMESHLASFTHSAKIKQKEKILFVKNNTYSITVFILNGETLQFSRTVPLDFLKDKNSIEFEINKIKNSFESEKKENIKRLSVDDSEIKDEYKKYLEEKNEISSQSKWLISIGALIRGEQKQEEDNQISLLPVGTVEAYSYQKTKLFITLVRNIIIGVSIFFLFTFLATYFFIFSISKNIKNSLSITPISSDVSKKETLIRKINSLTLISQSILSTTPNWSILIDEIKSRTIDGIIISNFSAPSVNDVISIVGISKDRNTLNQFKKTLQESSYITGVELPITNLEQKGDIPFSISFRLINPSMLYYK